MINYYRKQATNRTVRGRIPTYIRGFSLPKNAQNHAGAQPAAYSMRTVGSFPRV